MALNAIDVIDRAIEILNNDSLIGNEHGDYCVPCALAKAKSKLDQEYGTEISFAPLIADTMNAMITGRFTEFDSDLPLVQARNACNPFIQRLDTTKDESMSVLARARTELTLDHAV